MSTEEFPWEKSPAAATKPAKKTAAVPKAPTDLSPSVELVPVPDSEDGPDTDNMPRADVLAIWKEKNELLAPLLEESRALTVSGIDDAENIARAGELAKMFRTIRLDTDKAHKTLKEYFLRGGQKVDKFKKAVFDSLLPEEERMKTLADFVATETARIQGELRVNRLIELKPFLAEGQSPMADLGTLEEKEWLAMLADAKDLHALKVARIAREEKEREEFRIAEEQRLERERQEREAEAARIRAEAEAARKENEKLKAEQEAERQRVAEEAARIEAERAAERRKAQEEREAQERALQAERDAAERERQKAEAAARAERERLQREAAAKAAEQQKLIDEANRKAQELERQAAEREAAERMAEAQRTAAAAEAARKAAAAPDREKLVGFADSLLSLRSPVASTPDGKALETRINAKLDWLAGWIKEETAKL